jgi:hypothetical protein
LEATRIGVSMPSQAESMVIPKPLED